MKTKKTINTLIYNKKGGKPLMKLAENFILKPNKNQQIILGCLGYASARLYNVGNYERKKYSKNSNKKIC